MSFSVLSISASRGRGRCLHSRSRSSPAAVRARPLARNVATVSASALASRRHADAAAAAAASGPGPGLASCSCREARNARSRPLHMPRWSPTTPHHHRQPDTASWAPAATSLCGTLRRYWYLGHVRFSYLVNISQPVTYRERPAGISQPDDRSDADRHWVRARDPAPETSEACLARRQARVWVPGRTMTTCRAVRCGVRVAAGETVAGSGRSVHGFGPVAAARTHQRKRPDPAHRNQWVAYWRGAGARAVVVCSLRGGGME